MNDNGLHARIRRPTEEIAFANIAREAVRLGVSQLEIIRRDSLFLMKNLKLHSTICHCMYCKRKRHLQMLREN